MRQEKEGRGALISGTSNKLRKATMMMLVIEVVMSCSKAAAGLSGASGWLPLQSGYRFPPSLTAKSKGRKVLQTQL
jgi:hypothetical protein